MHCLCGRVCRLHGSLVTSSGETDVEPALSLPQFTVVWSDSTRGQNFTLERQSTFTISHFYLFICLFFFIYFFIFLNIKLLKQLSKRGH